MRNTDQRSSTGPVDAGPRSCGVRVGEQAVDLTQRHASSAIAHLEKNIWSEQFPHPVTAIEKKKKKKKCSSSALPSLSDLQFPERPVCGWRDTPWHRRITPWWPAWRSAFLSNVKQKRKEMYKNVKLRHVNKPSNCEFKKVKILP